MHIKGELQTNKRIQAVIGHLYRRTRNAAYWLLDPFDALFRNINRLGNYPPIHLRRHVSCLGSLDGRGYEFTAYLKLLLGLRAGQSLWDIGCGCGLLELALEHVGWRGRLIGVDIHKPSIRWAQRTISRRVPSFQFVHTDIYNPNYWSHGKESASEWFSGFTECDFDIVVAKSLFTHMLPEELDVYLRQINVRLKPTGKALLTFFMLNSEQEELQQSNQISFVKPHPGVAYAVRYVVAPTAAVAYEESYLIEHLDKNGLKADKIYYGSWTGRGDALSSQDMVVVSKCE